MGGARLLCVGALTLDTIFKLKSLPDGPGKFIPDDVMQIAAGMAASAATAAARQGGRVSLWASVGDDAVGRDIVAEISAEGVDCSLVRQVGGGRSAMATNLVGADGERIIVPYYDPVTHADPAQLPCETLDLFDAVLVDVRWPGAAALALGGARRLGIPAILDADVAPLSVLERLLPLASHVVASRPAATILCGRELPAGEAIARLAEMSDGMVAITDGGNGTYWIDRERTGYQHEPAPRIEAVDTLAAGDVFHGCFALAVAEGRGLKEAISFASAAAAIKCQRFGGRLGAPTRDETLAFLERTTPLN
jgi:sulfofructose kinase